MNTSHNQTQHPATKPAHTPTLALPIATGEQRNSHGFLIFSASGRTVAVAPQQSEAALIVRAVNSHETVCGLLAECEALVDATTAHRIREVLRQVRGA